MEERLQEQITQQYINMKEKDKKIKELEKLIIELEQHLLIQIETNKELEEKLYIVSRENDIKNEK